MATAVKICGITSIADAELAVECGASAIGLNFWPGSARCVDVTTARSIVDAVGERILVVGVFVDATLETLRDAKRETGIACLQLHGDEPPELLEPFLPHAYKALRVRGPGIAEEAEKYGGRHILLDAYSSGSPGGTGTTFDWELASLIARRRKLTLAGGLTAENVGQAIERVHPYCVDVASGVEYVRAPDAPGSERTPRLAKDPARVRAFIAAVRASSSRGD